MALGPILPEEVGPQDAARVLAFVNGVLEAEVLADAVGFAEGPDTGRAVAAEMLAARDQAGGFATLGAILGVTRVTPARFTEIVMALSAARPRRAEAARSLAIALQPQRPWLGQSVAVSLRLVDAAGRGVPGARLTVIATWGRLGGRDGTEPTHGASAEVTTGTGGEVGLRLDPALDPPLAGPARTALEAELVRLPADGSSAAEALAGFAERYRGEAGAALRAAIDRLFAGAAVAPAGRGGPLPILPVTLVAVGGGGAGPVAVATAGLRDWRGAWLSALRDAVAGDARLGGALRNVRPEDAKGADLARRLVGASTAIAGLERGLLAQAFRDGAASSAVNGFLAENAERIGSDGLAGVVRAAGASSAAIKGGGLKVFETIRTVQSTPSLGRGAVDAGRLEELVLQVEGIEARAVDRVALDGLRRDLGEQIVAARAELQGRLDAKADIGVVDGRLTRLEQDRVVRADLQALQTELAGKADAATLADLRQDVERLGTETVELHARTDARLTRVEQDRVVRADIAALQAQIDDRVEIAALAELRTGIERLRAETAQLTNQFETRLLVLERDRVVRADIAGLEARIAAKADAAALGGLQQGLDRLRADTNQLSTRLENRLTVLERDRVLRADLTALEGRLDAKADAASVAGLQQGLDRLRRDTQQISTRIDTVNADLIRVGVFRPGGPPR